MATVLPVFDPGDDYTADASAAITGGRLVEVTGDNTVAHAGAASAKVVGVAPADALSGARVLVKRDGIWDLVCAATVAAGDRLVAAANGQVTPYDGVIHTPDLIVATALAGGAAAATCRAALLLR
jgi:hypothetical protein